MTEQETDSTCYNVHVPLSVFTPASVKDIKEIIMNWPNKSCNLDPIPTWLLKSCVGPLIPIFLGIVNNSLASGKVSQNLKTAHIRLFLKEAGLDSENFKNYRPISNLNYLSILVEKVVSIRLDAHLNIIKLGEPLQSGYAKLHSTETVLLKVQSDIMLALDRKKIRALVLLALSAAFDTIDHQALLQRLKALYGIKGMALNWLSSYVSNRQQSLAIDGYLSEPAALEFGVPQGPILGPKLYTMYTKPLGSLIANHSLDYRMYTYDTQVWSMCHLT